MTGQTALVVVDMQQDFLARAGLEPERDQLIGFVEQLLVWVRQQAWPVVHVHTRVSIDQTDWLPHWRLAGRADCIANTPGAQPPAGLAPEATEVVVFKKHFNGFESPLMLSTLYAAGVDTILLAGVHTHACIRETAAAAHAHGFRVIIVTDAVGSYDPGHARMTLDWIDGRLARCLAMSDLPGLHPAAPAAMSRTEITRWQHRNPCDWDEVLGEFSEETPVEIAKKAASIAAAGPDLARLPIAQRADMLLDWKECIEANREKWVDALVREVGKPRADAAGELAYGTALLDTVIAGLTDHEQTEPLAIRYHPQGCMGLITPWNNPFAIPVSKIAPALGFGNAALWKPSPLAGGISAMIFDSLVEAGFGRWVAMVQGGAGAGRAVVEMPYLDGLSFTGSREVGLQIAGECGKRMRPLQAELGGNNAAIVLADADLQRAAQDLAGAMFSFAGQRCTAIRRIIVDNAVRPAFTNMLVEAVGALRIGDPSALDTEIGPVVSRLRQHALLAAIAAARRDGADVLTGGKVPVDRSERGCWLEPTILAGVAPTAALAQEESFGPLALLFGAAGLDDAIAMHNGVDQGLLGAIYSTDKANQSAFLSRAQAGMLLINQARPRFSSSGPFIGWKASGFGPPEHGRWNREVYTRAQAIYHG